MNVKISPMIYSGMQDPEIEISEEEYFSIQDLVDSLEIPIFAENPFEGWYPGKNGVGVVVYVDEKCWLYVLGDVVVVNRESAFEDTSGVLSFLQALAKKYFPESKYFFEQNY